MLLRQQERPHSWHPHWVQRDRPANLIALSVLPLAQDDEGRQLVQRSMLSDYLIAGDGVVPWHVWQCLRIAVIVPCHQG